MPQTTSQAQYSLAFAVAVMATHGTIALANISGRGLTDPVVTALVGRTHAEVHDRHESRFPQGRWADVAITLSDGRTLLSGDTHARGGPERPFSNADVCDKFMSYAEPVVGSRRAAAIRDATLRLHEPGPAFADLTGLLIEAP